MKKKLPKLSNNEREALSELKKRLKEKFGDGLKKVILYGSKARGDSNPESDLDVLIELSDPGKKAKPVILSPKDGSRIELPEISRKAKSAISDMAFRTGLKYDVLIACVACAAGRLRMRKKIWMPFIENVIKDGVLI